MTATTSFPALGDERFVSLATFRRTGIRVATPVWIVKDGSALLVTTPADSGKVKRLRNDPRVEMVPCGRLGKPTTEATPVSGVAEVVDSDDARRRLETVFRRKYGLEYRFFMLVERLLGPRSSPRVMLRVTPD